MTPHNMTADERLQLFKNVSEKIGLSVFIVEKDFWVVWTLWRLFEQKELRPYLTFKGGTSLSKVFGVIKRFSEDIDLSIEKSFFGFDEANAPEHAPSRKKRSMALEKLSAACSKYIQNDLLKLLNNDFENLLGSGTQWALRIDTQDPDQQTILFDYPKTGKNDPYIHHYIKLELGARSEHWPVSERKIRSYAKEQFENGVVEPEITIKVLDIERTFWEKATILHAYAHVPVDRKIPLRLARHYYDMHCLLHSEIKSKAANDIALLERVVKHKTAYFASTWAQFETAKRGTLKLRPSDKLEKHLRADYAAMRDMFFVDPPVWSDIIDTIRMFETEFNDSCSVF